MVTRPRRPVHLRRRGYLQPALADNAVDTAVTVRTLHHIRDLKWAFSEIARVVRADGTYVTEYANKRHLKAILRWLARQQSENPFDRAPYEFVELNIDFHPEYLEGLLRQAGFVVRQERAVSTFRLPALKQLAGSARLARLDGLVQVRAARLKVSPSVFLRTILPKPGRAAVSPVLWRCPRCHGTELAESPGAMTCACGAAWTVDDGIYDFNPGG